MVARSNWPRVVGAIALLALALLGGRYATGAARPSVPREPSSDMRQLIEAVDDRGLASMLGSALTDAHHGEQGFSLSSPRLMVSYNGVLALVFGGWPTAALDAKDAIDQQLISGLAGFQGLYLRERGGSKFPKTSLAALCRDCALTASQLNALQQLCAKWSLRADAAAFRLEARRLSLIAYRNRCLSAPYIKVWNSKLGGGEADVDDKPAPSQRVFVGKVIDEAAAVGERASVGYLAKVNAPGNRAPHYAEPVEGLSVVSLWRDSNVGAEPDWLQGFFAEVDVLLPGQYARFPFASLHVTLRGVIELDGHKTAS